MAKFIDLDTGLPALLNKVKAWVNSKTEDFITAEDAAGIVAATGDLVIVENDSYIDILITESQVNITPASLALYAAQKSAVIKVSGTHLKNDISISVPTGFTASPSTIAQVNGTVAQTDVTIAYTGADASTASGNITATAGDVVKSIPVAYSQYAGPTILADSTLTIKAAAGQSNTGSLRVTGLNLTAVITATVSGTGFTVSSSENGTYGNQASLPSSGGTLYVKFSPAGSTGSTGTLTLESTGATSKTVDLTGAVVSLTVSESSLTFSTTVGTPATQTFTVRGANLTQDISISASGTGFSVSPATIDKDGAGTAQTVTVTYNPSAAGTNTGTVTIQSSGLSETITLSGSAVGVPVVDGEGKFTATVGGKDFYCKVISGTTNVEIHNSGYVTGYNATLPTLKYSGDVVVPSKVTAIYNNVATEFTVVKLAANSFKSCSGLTSLTLPNTLTEIALCAINDCSNNSFTSLVIPNSVTTLGLCPVYQCKKLTSLIIGTGVATLTNYFGAGCLSLSSINIPDNVTEIKDYCFSGGQGNDGNIYFDTVTIGSGLTKISGNSRFKMKAGSAVTINRATPPTLNGTVFVDTSNSTPCGATLYVPSANVATYQGTSAYATQFGTSNIKAIQ